MFSAIVSSILRFTSSSDLRSLHVLIFLIVHRLQKMSLYLDRFNAVGIKRFECIDQCHRNDRASGLGGRFETASLKGPRMVAVLGNVSLPQRSDSFFRF